jgi:hypothetical protein
VVGLSRNCGRFKPQLAKKMVGLSRNWGRGGRFVPQVPVGLRRRSKKYLFPVKWLSSVFWSFLYILLLLYPYRKIPSCKHAYKFSSSKFPSQALGHDATVEAVGEQPKLGESH